jgi:CRP/FNR family transcriptional regulator, cyclic AMP receptor protein
MTMTIDLRTLRSSLIFKDVPDSVLAEVAAHCQFTRLSAGDTLFQQDSAPDSMYFLESGQVHIVRHYPDGGEVILATESPYYVIGELSLLADQPRTGTVVAVSDCEMFRLNRDPFMNIYQRYPEVAVNALVHLGQRLYRLNLSVRESAIGNAQARIASMLLLISGGATGQVSDDVQVSRLARATALEPGLVNRVMAQWSKQGLIAYDGRRLTIHDARTIRDLAG